MKVIPINKIKNEAQARQLAVDYQSWASKRSLSYKEVAEWGSYFYQIGENFGLTKEFEENGII
jgi:hypothetical protein